MVSPFSDFELRTMRNLQSCNATSMDSLKLGYKTTQLEWGEGWLLQVPSKEIRIERVL